MNYYINHLCLKIPRTECGTGFRYVRVPSASHGQVRAAHYPIPATRGRPHRIPGDLRWAHSFQTTWRESFQRNTSSSERGPEPVCTTKAHVCVTDGILHGGSIGAGLVDGQKPTEERNAPPGCPPGHDRRADDAP